MSKVPKHLAIILDGNGRWAKRRGMPRNLGHYQGATNLFKIANEAKELGIEVLTVYAFSTENWSRPEEEVNYLMTEPAKHMKSNMDKLKKLKYKIKFVGRRDRFPKETLDTINELEELTKHNDKMLLQVAFDYGSREEITQALNKMEKPYTEEKIREHLYVKQDVDLLIRTSGEQRLSNFLLWQVSYAEFIFVRKHWPSFKKRDLRRAVKKYSRRNRRFGGL